MQTSTVNPTNCTVFIQVWIDVNALVPGSLAGVYLVDNQYSNGSSGEGTTSLMTNVAQGQSVCWQILPIDPEYAGQNYFSFSNIAASTGFSQPPLPWMPKATSGQDVWTCTVSKSATGGVITDGISINYTNGQTSWQGSLTASGINVYN